MTQFYFDSRLGADSVYDTEGQDFPNLEAAVANAVVAARDLMSDPESDGKLDMDGQIDICCPLGIRIASVSFKQAIATIR